MKIKKIVIKIILIALIILPQCSVLAVNTENVPNLYSESAILIDTKTDLTLYEKNSTKKMYPASTTKILTAIIALEQCNLDEKIIVSKSAISQVPEGYSTCYLASGEEVPALDLITMFLVHSGNDAGYVLAEHISGSTQKFAELMNKKALELGCKNSNFTNPCGIHDDNHFSTAYDLYLIAKYCMKNDNFRKIVSQKQCIIPATNKTGVRKYSNTNELLNPSSKYYLKNCIGIKTGYTSQAKNCLISSCLEDNLEFIAVVLGGDNTEKGDNSRFVDSKTLFQYGYSNYSMKTIAKKGDILTTVEVKNAIKENKNLDLLLEDDINALVKNTDDNFEYTISLNPKISAPISQNTCLGTITYTINGITYSGNLLASNNVEKNNYTILILSVSLGSLLILIIIFNLKSKKHKKKRKYYNEY